MILNALSELDFTLFDPNLNRFNVFSSVYPHFYQVTILSAFASERLVGMMRWKDEGYLMYFFHSKLLFIPVLWKEKEGRNKRENGETSEEGTEERKC